MTFKVEWIRMSTGKLVLLNFKTLHILAAFENNVINANNTNPMFHFYTLSKRQKTKGLLKFHGV